MRNWVPVAALMVSVAAGTAADRPAPHVVRTMDRYEVLAADFHVHVFPFGWAFISPRETLLEAVHQGLDVVAITPHDQTWQADLARWLAPRLTRSPIVLKGEEITTPRFHVLAIGVDGTVSNQLALEDTLDTIHRRGGVAIAAHPYRVVWGNYDAESMKKLDGSEVVRPEAQFDAAAATELREFNARAPLTAFGNSDYRGPTPMGFSRTYVFATARTAEAVMDALRARRTVVYDRDRAYGDHALIALADANGGLPRNIPAVPAPGWLRAIGRLGTLGALVALVLFNRWNNVAVTTAATTREDVQSASCPTTRPDPAPQPGQHSR